MQSTEQIPFNDLSRMSPELRREIDTAIAKVVSSGWFVLGPEHAGFETELGEYLGVNDTVLVGNGTDALELALAAVGVDRGDVVVTVANAGGYSTIAARLLGASLEYCDVDPVSLQMTATTFEAVLSRLEVAPKAVVVTHLYGSMAPVAQIVAIARKHGIAVVEDCAQSLGARSDGRLAGTFGDIAITSFYPTKNLGALGDGGAVFTNNGELAESVRKMRQYGWGGKYRIVHKHGRNSRLDEMQAAILRVKLPYLDVLNARRREIHAQYERALGGRIGVEGTRLVGAASESFIAHLAVVAAADRERARTNFSERNIGTDVHYPIPDHRQPYQPGVAKPVSLPVTEAATESIFSIPMFPELTGAEVDRISEALHDIGGNGGS